MIETPVVPEAPIDPPEPKPADRSAERADAAHEAAVEDLLHRSAVAAQRAANAATYVGREAASVASLLSACVGTARAALAAAVAGTGCTVKVKAEYRVGFGDRFFDGGNNPSVTLYAQIDGEFGTFSKTAYRDPRSPDFLPRFDAVIEELAAEVSRKARFLAFERAEKEREDAERWDGQG